VSRAPEITATLFGPLELRAGAARFGPRDLGGVKPKQLLELLLLERGRPVPKDRIVEALWAERLPRDAAATIATYVSVLRRRLGRGLGRRLIVTEHGAYRVPRDELVVDIDVYEALLREAAGSDGEERRRLLGGAVEIGELELVSDEPYATWVIPLREHYRERQAQALVDLAESCLVLGDDAGAAAAAERAIARDPTRERAHRAAMLARETGGDRAGALRAYERCRRVLREELGVSPSRALIELHGAIVRAEHPSAPAIEPIRYARNGSVRIAYQTVGAGSLDLVFSPSHVSNLGATWDDPTYARFLQRLAGMARLILFDKRGTGLSDPALDFPTTRERSEDLVAVLDAVGSERAVLFGVCGGGALCMQLAADHPDRVAALILHNAIARMLSCHDYPWGWEPAMYERLLDGLDEAWLGNGERLVRRNPSLADNPRYRSWFARYVRLAANPWLARRLAEMNRELDVRDALPEIRAPSVVVCRTEDVWLSADNSRYLARRIPGARLVELPGVDHDPWVGDSEEVLAVVEAFLSELAVRPASAAAIPASAR
jgi:pimeloyl-ACP methyl ester carboxylesterase/DNA-binding SARP family transcriptional activator